MFRSRPVYFFTVVLLVAIDGLGCHVLATLNFTLGTLDTPFQCNVEGNLWCAGNASTSSGETLHLIPDERNQSQEFYFNTMGMALFSSPVDMVDAKGRWMSFSTHFIFEIESRFLGFPGDGMAFVMLSEQVEGSPGGSFGIYNKHGWQVVQTLAIEFDTFQNTEIDDRSRNHVGVDLETIRSKVSRDAQEVDIDLAGDRTINAWIDYHAVSELLEVRIDLHGTKPKESFLTYPLALSDVFPESGTVYVGFSGSNGYYTCHNFYSIQDWNFQVFPENRSILYLVEIIGGIFILIVIIVVLICGRLHRRSLYTPLLPGDVEREELSCRRFSYKELVVATNHFDQSQKLGEGGFGSVYRGVLGGRSKSDSGSRQWVAVKKLKENSSQGKNEFQAELSIISKLQHRHIVRLLGWCGEKQELMLVYDLMPNGGLDKALFNSKLDPVLSWKQRYRMILDVASALSYLHAGWRQQIIHRDIKTSNIMLDSDYRAMLGDFGLARLVNHDQTLDTTLAAGTLGYLAPEAFMTGKFTDKTDVYAFGTVLLEIVCGRKALDKFPMSKETLLVNWVWSMLDAGDPLNVVDGRLGGEFDRLEANVVIRLGLLCSHPIPKDRPSMCQITSCLETRKLTGVPPVPSPRPQYHRSYSYEDLLQSTTKMALTRPGSHTSKPPLTTKESLPLSTYSS